MTNSVSEEDRATGVARGFSLIEVMITITVVAVLLVVALPSFRDVNISNNVTELTNQLVTDLNTARSEAVRRGTLVAVIANGGDWNTGWYIETDGDFKADGTFAAPPVTSGNDVVLGTRPAVPTGGYKINAKAGTGGSSQVVFTAQGTLYKSNSFDINVCRPDSKPKRSKHVAIGASGITSSSADTTSSPAPSC